MPIATPEAYRRMIDTAKSQSFAFPAVNCVGSEAVNAAIKGFADVAHRAGRNPRVVYGCRTSCDRRNDRRMSGQVSQKAFRANISCSASLRFHASDGAVAIDCR
jgi:hypothetical protein